MLMMLIAYLHPQTKSHMSGTAEFFFVVKVRGAPMATFYGDVQIIQ